MPADRPSETEKDATTAAPRHTSFHEGTDEAAVHSSAGGALRRAARDQSFRAAFFSFTLTRVIVLAILIVGGQVARVVTDNGGVHDVYLSLRKIPVARILAMTVQTADINWYTSIASGGYDKQPFATDQPHNWAFFPLYPLLLRLCSYLTGEFAVTGVVLSNIFFLFALVFAHKTALAFGFNSRVADRAVFYLSVFPTSFFFSLPMTESLFLLLTAGSFYQAKRGRWWVAGALGALASGTRVTGVLLLPALAMLYWQSYARDWRRREALGLCIVPVGLAAFMCYLYAITGNPLAFKDILVTWGRETGLFLIPLFEYARQPLVVIVPWDFRPVNFAAPVMALACGAVLWRWRQRALAVYTLAAVFVALSSLILQSQARYAMVLFPVFYVLAVAGERTRVDELIRTVLLALLCLMTALFAAHFSLALS